MAETIPKEATEVPEKKRVRDLRIADLSPEEQEKKRAYHREYAKKFRLKHKDRLKIYNSNYWRTKKRYVRRKKMKGDRRCVFCEIKLGMKAAGAKRVRYCETCKSNPAVKAYLWNLYMRRHRQKKAGLPVEPIVFARVFFKNGRPAKKSLIPRDSAL